MRLKGCILLLIFISGKVSVRKLIVQSPNQKIVVALLSAGSIIPVE